MRIERSTSLGHVNSEIKFHLLSTVRSEPVHRVSSIEVVLCENIVSTSLVVEDIFATFRLGGNVVPSRGRSYKRNDRKMDESERRIYD